MYIPKNMTVDGVEYLIYSDFMKRGTISKKVETGEVRQISFSGYIKRPSTIKNAIRLMWNKH